MQSEKNRVKFQLLIVKHTFIVYFPAKFMTLVDYERQKTKGKNKTKSFSQKQQKINILHKNKFLFWKYLLKCKKEEQRRQKLRVWRMAIDKPVFQGYELRECCQSSLFIHDLYPESNFSLTEVWIYLPLVVGSKTAFLNLKTDLIIQVDLVIFER